jgi:hypothetical protein
MRLLFSVLGLGALAAFIAWNLHATDIPESQSFFTSSPQSNNFITNGTWKPAGTTEPWREHTLVGINLPVGAGTGQSNTVTWYATLDNVNWIPVWTNTDTTNLSTNYSVVTGKFLDFEAVLKLGSATNCNKIVEYLGGN